MRIYIDEAGPFLPPNPPRPLFSLVLALVVPKAIEKDLFDGFLRLRDTWQSQNIEVKGSSLNESQAAQFINLVLNDRLQIPGWKDFGGLLVRHKNPGYGFVQIGMKEGDESRMTGYASRVCAVLDKRAKSMIVK